MALLEIKNLSVAFGSAKSCFHAVEGVSLSVDPGEVLGVVGESGSGKSVTMMAVMGLLDASPPTRFTSTASRCCSCRPGSAARSSARTLP